MTPTQQQGYERKPQVWSHDSKQYGKVKQNSDSINLPDLDLLKIELYSQSRLRPITNEAIQPTYPWENPIPQLRALADAIKKSKELLDIPDESNSDGAKPPTTETWLSACRFIWNHAMELLDYSGNVIDIPLFTPTPFGGVGLDWNKDTFRMLLTVWPDNNRVTYYGDDTKWKSKVKGKTRTNEIDKKLISWFNYINE